MNEKIIAFVDKTVVKITGLSMKGVKPFELEDILQNRLNRAVRVIGVSGTDLKLDVYGLAPEEILADEKGIISALSLSKGVFATDVAQIAEAERAREVPIEELEKTPNDGCPRERHLDL
jgi:hypothetical protein